MNYNNLGYTPLNKPLLYNPIQSSYISDSFETGNYKVSMLAGNDVSYTIEKVDNYNGGEVKKKYESKTDYALESSIMKEDVFVHESFLRPDRPFSRIIGCSDEIIEGLRTCYNKLTGRSLPGDIEISVLSHYEFEKLASEKVMGRAATGVLGFAYNHGFGNRGVYVRRNHLDILFVVLGHEIGHVLSKQMEPIEREEAKAYAFQLAWVEAIVSFDILGLKNSINPNEWRPPKDSEHEKALEFVTGKIREGMKPIDVFNSLISGKMNWAFRKI